MNDRRELLIRFNEQSNSIELYAAHNQGKHFVLDFPRPHTAIELSRLVKDGANEAERRVGSLVMSFLDFYSGSRMQIRDYQKLGREYDVPGDTLRTSGDAQFEKAMQLIDSSLQSRSPADLREAERHLLQAAANGNEDAKRFLDADWPRTKALALRRLADDS